MSLVTIAREAFAVREGCGGCVFFRNDPAAIERALPGISSFSSSHASVRANDGLCERHGALINGRQRCAEFQER